MSRESRRKKQPITKRTYLVLRVMETEDVDMMIAMEAVSSTAIEHPEWDLNERRTWAEWEEWEKQSDA